MTNLDDHNTDEDGVREIFPVRGFTPEDSEDLRDIRNFGPVVLPADAPEEVEEEVSRKDPKDDTATEPVSSQTDQQTSEETKSETPVATSASSESTAVKKPTSGSRTSSSAKKTG